jgi:hypothetical protein
MPRRNRNAGTPRPDADQLAADLAQLAAELCPDTWTKTMCGTGTTAVIARYRARPGQARYPLAVTGGNQQPIPQLIPGSR